MKLKLIGITSPTRGPNKALRFSGAKGLKHRRGQGGLPGINQPAGRRLGLLHAEPVEPQREAQGVNTENAMARDHRAGARLTDFLGTTLSTAACGAPDTAHTRMG